jgi:hypothetical protein
MHRSGNEEMLQMGLRQPARARLNRTGGTMRRIALHGNPLWALVLGVTSGRPLTTLVSLRTRHGLRRPIHGKTGAITPLWPAGLPTGIRQHRPP